MGEDDGHNRGRRKGVTLLRALVATFKWQLMVAALLLIGDSVIHIAQVGGRAREETELFSRTSVWDGF